MLPRLAIIFGVMTALLVGAGRAEAEKRVALVVGNAAYVNTPALRNPRNDASDMAAALTRLGFDVVLGLDLDQQKFAALVAQFARRLDDADVALFYYAGHGLQINGKNYLVSVDARLKNEFLIPSETIELESIIGVMESKVPTNLVFLDACRNNPLADDLRRNLVAMNRSASLGRGLARIEPTRRDTLIAFAAAPGQVAADGDGRNSPFTSALLKYLPQPNLEISVMLKLVAAQVGQLTHDTQRPQQMSDMTRTFYFANGSGVAAAKPEASDAGPSAPVSVAKRSPPVADDRDVEIAYWNSVQAANDCEAVRAYRQKFPNGIFMSLAAVAEQRLCQPQQRHVTLLEASPDTNSEAAKSPAAVSGPPKAQPALPPAPSLNQTTPAPPAPSVLAPPAAPAQPSQQTVFVNPGLAPPQAAPGAERAFRDCEHCPEMVRLPGGTFEMGSKDDPTESPVHRVSVKPFAIGRYPVKIGEWKACVAAGACRYSPKGGDDLPVYNISWDDAQEYVAWLSRTTGKTYRLPTEAEWEYAARAGTTSRYWWGDHVVPGKAACKGCGSAFSGSAPMKAGLFGPNGFGLFDMTGSIDQWVSDCWNRNYVGAPGDGSSWQKPNCRQHVLRGGSWQNDASYSRTSSRDSYDTDVRYPTHGLRVVRTSP